MSGLPKNTEYNKAIPKQSFYQKTATPSNIKRLLEEQVQRVVWANKLAPFTIGVPAGDVVDEIQVLRISLRTEVVDEAILRFIDKAIPYRIVFVLEYQEKYQLWISCREVSGGLCDKYYHTEWSPTELTRLNIEGANLDEVWERFVVQIGDLKMKRGASLPDRLLLKERSAKLQKEIERLERKARNEKQPNKKFELARQANGLKKELELMQN